MKFRCPHCRQKTISAWSKLKPGGWKPSACPQCGGKYLAAWWGILPAAFVFPLVLFVPFWFAHGPIPNAVFLAMLGLGAALALLVSAAVYLLITPLLREGSAAARWDRWTWGATLAGLVVALLVMPDEWAPPPPTGHSTPRVSGGMSYGHAEYQQEFKDALGKAGIPYTVEMKDGREFAYWTSEQHAAVEAIKRELELLEGRSVSFSNPILDKAFKDWLAKNGVAYRTVQRRGRDYVAWEGEPELLKKFMAEVKFPDCPKAAGEVTSKNC